MVNSQEIHGKDGIGVYIEEAMKILASRMKKDYEHVTMTRAGATVNRSVKVDEGKFVKMQYAHTILIRTNADITFKLNSTVNDSIPLSAGEGSISLDAVEVQDIFISTAGAAVINILIA